MLRNDGLYVIYYIQHQEKNPKKWVGSNLDYFGYPKGFTASGTCWQETGTSGTYARKEADRGLNWIKAENPKIKFRLVCIIASQKTMEVI